MDGISKKNISGTSGPTEDDNRSDQRRIQDGLKEQGIEAKSKPAGTAKTISAVRRGRVESDRVAGVGRSDVAWRGSGSGRYHRVTLRCGGGSGKHHRGCPSGGLRDRKDPGRNQHVQRADPPWNGHSDQNLSLSGRPWNAGDPSKSAGNQHYHLCERTGSTAKKLPENSCIAMAIGGNTTMIHFLLGMDAFCVFHTPYAAHADQPGFLPAKDLELPVKGYVYIYPAKSNYLGGDIISGMVATGIYKKREDQRFFSISERTGNSYWGTGIFCYAVREPRDLHWKAVW